MGRHGIPGVAFATPSVASRLAAIAGMVAMLACVCVGATAPLASGADATTTTTGTREASSAPVQTPFDDATGVPLVVANRTVFVFRAPLGPLTPQERSDHARHLLEEAISTRQRYSVTVESTAVGPLIRYGLRRVFVVSPADLDSARGETLADASIAAARATSEAVNAGIEQRNPRRLAIQVALVLLATLLLVVLLWLLITLDGRVTTRVRSSSERQLGDLATRGLTVAGQDRMLNMVIAGIHGLTWIAGLSVGYLWLTFCLRRFPYTQPWGDALRGLMLSNVAKVLLSILHAIPGLFTILVIVVFTKIASRIIGAVFLAIERGSLRVGWIHPDTAVPTRRITVTVLWLLAIVSSYPYIPGSDTAAFKGASVLFGLLLSFGSSGVVSQAMSGLVLMYSRAFKRGEYIRINEIEGTVAEVGMLSTKIVTNKHEEITLPNSLLVGTTTKNYTRLAAERGLRVSTSVTIGYDAPWRQVHAMLQMAAERTAGLKRDPKSYVLQTALSDFYVEYMLVAEIERPERRIRVLAELHQNILDAFNEYGVQILSPHFEGEPAQKAVVPRSQWYAAPAQPPTSEPAAPPSPEPPARG